MMRALDEARHLLRLALRDGDTFALLLPLPQATFAALGFHAQQAIEKVLKAVYTRQNLEVRRAHDLAALGQTVLDHGTALPISVDELRSLNPFAVAFRYDDEIASSLKPCCTSISPINCSAQQPSRSQDSSRFMGLRGCAHPLSAGHT